MYGTLVGFRNPLGVHKRAHRAAYQYLRSKGIDTTFGELLRLNNLQYNLMLKIREKTGREVNFPERYARVLKSLGYHIPTTSPIVEGAIDTFFEEYFRSNYLLPGVKTVLRVLKNEYRLGLLSNFPHKSAYKILLRKLDIATYFDSLVFSGSFGWAKPSARIFTKSLSQLKVRPQEAAYVGDTLDEDVLGAKRAGIFSIFVKRKRTEEEEFGYEENRSKVIPDMTIRSVSELPRLLHCGLPSNLHSFSAKNIRRA